jgi:hypothetical protein
MPGRRPQPTARSRNNKTRFQPGHSGACEARLYQFTGVANGDGELPVMRVAARSLLEATLYMEKWHAELDVVHVEFVAMIEMVSGSPLN